MSGELQHRAGIVMQHKKGAVIEVACDPHFWFWSLVMSVDTQKFVTEFVDFSNSSGHGSIKLGDRAIVSLEQGQNISISPKYGQRMGRDEVVVHVDCNVENHVGLSDIFSDDSIGGTSDDVDGF